MRHAPKSHYLYTCLISLVSDETKEINPSFAIPARALLKNVFPPESAQERRILEDVFEKIAASVGKKAEAE